MNTMKLAPQRFGMSCEELIERIRGHMLTVCHDRTSGRQGMIVVKT